MRFLIVSSVLFLLAGLFSFNTYAYQTELTLTGNTTHFNEHRIIYPTLYPSQFVTDNAGAAFHLDYAFTEHITDGAPLAEAQFYRPQSHVYLSSGNLPTISTSFNTWQLSSNPLNTTNTTDIGGNYFFSPYKLFVGGNYRFFDSQYGKVAAESSISTGGYPIKGLRVMLTINRFNANDDHFNTANVAVRYLANLGAQYALANELVYTEADDRFGANSYAYNGEFYFNQATALLYGYKIMNIENSGSDIPSYQVGTEHFFNDTTSAKFLYSYEYFHSGFNYKYSLRTIALNMNVRF